MFKFVFLVFLTGWLTSGFSQAAESEKLSIITSEYTYNVEIYPQGNDQLEIDELLEARRNFETLTSAERSVFEHSRSLYLNKTAILLNKNKLLLGVFSSSAEFLGNLKNELLQKRQEIPDGEIGIIVRRHLQEEADRLEKLPAEKKQLKEKGHLAIGSLLQTINKILYKQAKAVCSSDEIGISMGAGLGLNAGLGSIAAGAIAELQFLFGYNRKTKAVVFEIHSLLEKMKRPLTPLLNVGIDLRGGLYIKDSKVRHVQKGESLFTPAIPTAFSGYPAHADTYLSSGIGFPPMATEFMGYISTSYRVPLMRLEVSFEPKLNFKISFGFSRRGVGIHRARCSTLFSD